MPTNIAWWRATGALTLACVLGACGGGDNGGNTAAASTDIQKTEARASSTQPAADPSDVRYAP